jgi:GT2 family glycosyltransferase
VQVRTAALAMRRTAMRELGPSPGSVAAVVGGMLAIPRAALLDAVVPRRRPGTSHPAPSPISVVVPTYGRPDLLGRCLDALDAQEPGPAEVVVVARPDDRPTMQMLDRWTAEDPERRRMVHVDRPGLVHALDAGTRAVRCEAVAYLDDDAIPRPGWLAELGIGLLDPTVGAVGGSLVDYVRGVPRTGRTRRVGVITWYGRIIGRHHLQTEHYGDVDWLTGSNVAIRTELARHDANLVHTSNGLALANDLDTSLSVRRAGYRVLFSPWAVVEHHTTSFRDSALGTRVAGPDVETSAANHTYALLKFLPRGRRATFLCYAFVVGQASLPGPLRALAEVPRSRERARAMAARIPGVWRGRRLGMEMWRRWRTGQRSADADSPVAV